MTKLINITAKDVFNANTATDFRTVAKEGREIEVVGFGVFEEVSSEGNVKRLGIIKDSEGNMYSGASAVMADRLLKLYDVVEEERASGNAMEIIPIQFVEFKSGRGMSTSFRLI